jgi:hypothetical protein
MLERTRNVTPAQRFTSTAITKWTIVELIVKTKKKLREWKKIILNTTICTNAYTSAEVVWVSMETVSLIP